MKKCYWKSLVEIIDILTPSEIIGLTNRKTYMTIITKVYDQKQDKKIDKICREAGMEWDFTPYVTTARKGKKETEVPSVKYIISEEDE